RKLKGKDRPICLEDERLTILSNFPFIDMLILFSDKTPLKLIKAIKDINISYELFHRELVI
mgnify:CR=1